MAKATMYNDDIALSFSSDNIEEVDAAFNAELACLEKWFFRFYLFFTFFKVSVYNSLHM